MQVLGEGEAGETQAAAQFKVQSCLVKWVRERVEVLEMVGGRGTARQTEKAGGRVKARMGGSMSIIMNGGVKPPQETYERIWS